MLAFRLTCTKMQENKQDNSRNNFFKKTWYSISKFEKYPELAAEGTKNALIYLGAWVLIFAIIITAVNIINLGVSLNDVTKYIEGENIRIDYKEGNLGIYNKDGQNLKINEKNDIINRIIIDTETENEEEIESYKKLINTTEGGVVFLKDKFLLKTPMNTVVQQIKYTEMAENYLKMDITEFNEKDVIDVINGSVVKQYMITLFFATIIIEFLTYGMTIIINIFTIAILGNIAKMLIRVPITFKSIWNMAIYSFTLPVILEILYYVVYSITKFEVTYFEVAYMGIAFIYLLAAIFMIKAEIAKKQQELIEKVQQKLQTEAEGQGGDIGEDEDEGEDEKEHNHNQEKPKSEPNSENNE